MAFGSMRANAEHFTTEIWYHTQGSKQVASGGGDKTVVARTMGRTRTLHRFAHAAPRTQAGSKNQKPCHVAAKESDMYEHAHDNVYNARCTCVAI